MKKISKWFSDNLSWIVVAGVAILCALFMIIGTVSDNGYITLDGADATITDTTKGWIEDANEMLKGMYTKQDGIEQMGAFPYYKVDVSTPTAFYNAVNGRGFNEGWGYQCVAGFKEFQYSLSGKVVATSTGGASGYANQQSQIEPLGFTWHSGGSGLQDGDWGIFSGGQSGHVAMYYQGKWFGQNQGAADGNVGNAFNLMGLNLNILGYYRPNIYNKKSPEPSPEAPQPTKPADTTSYTVKKGDTLGDIAVKLGWATTGLFGDTGYTQKIAEKNGIKNRGVIFPGQVIYKP